MEKKGYPIRIRALIEVLGKPREFVEEKRKEYVENIRKDDTLMILNEKSFDVKEHGKTWSIVTEIELVVKGVENMVGFCIEYMPSTIEIIKPESFNFEEREFTAFINDLLAKLHNIDMIAKTVKGENDFLKRNMNNLIKNNLQVFIRLGITDLEKLSKTTGIEQEEVKKYLERLIDEKRVKEDNGVYSIV